MNCCGKKRQALTASSAQIINEKGGEQSTPPAGPNGSQNTAIFHYTGSSSLEVSGLFNRRIYKFSTAMPDLVILPEDAAILRGYPELIELKR